MFKRDFTLKKYTQLCETLKESGYNILTVKDYLTYGGKDFIILRHDVDRNPKNALIMAKIEHEYGISSTFYFRKTKDVFVPDIIEKVSKLGHEIGYHYEVLDKARGDKKRALKLFQEELEEFRKIVHIETICMHGNPLASWSNKDLWREFDFKDFGILSEPYLSIDYSDVVYLSDTGRRWDGKYSVKDIVENEDKRFRTTDDVIQAIKTQRISKGCIIVHPNRWNDNIGPWLWELIGQGIKNIGKAGILLYRRF